MLHFGYSTAPLDTAECQKRLDKLWRGAFGEAYDKVDTGMYAKLTPMLDSACENAARLEGYHAQASNVKPSEKCPGTAIHAFFDELGPYLPGIKSEEAGGGTR